MIDFLKRTYLPVRGGVPIAYIGKSIELLVVGKLRLAVLLMCVLLSPALLNAQVNKPADVRVLIDISGSMKKMILIIYELQRWISWFNCCRLKAKPVFGRSATLLIW